MAVVARFDNPRTQLAACQWVRGFWVFLAAVNLAAAIHEALNAEWTALLNLGTLGVIAGAYRWALHPMIQDARRAHIARLEREIGFR